MNFIGLKALSCDSSAAEMFDVGLLQPRASLPSFYSVKVF